MSSLLAALWSTAIGCTNDGAQSTVEPAERAVRVSTEPCGDASGRDASGVLVAPGRVVTAAHVVADASTVEVRTPTGGRSTGEVEVLDLEADVAVLRIEDDGSQPRPVPFTSFDDGQVVRLVGAATSGDVELVVIRRARIEIEVVRSAHRTERDGYELRGSTADGDSGAGLFDADGRLGALLFATSSDRGATAFAIAAPEIDRALDARRTSFRCDPSRALLVESTTDEATP